MVSPRQPAGDSCEYEAGDVRWEGSCQSLSSQAAVFAEPFQLHHVPALATAVEWVDSTGLIRVLRSCPAMSAELRNQDGRLKLAHVVVKSRTALHWIPRTSASHIQSLELRPCGRQALEAALAHTPKMPHLRHITCKGQPLKAEDCQALAAVAKRQGAILRMLNIEACRVNDEALEAFQELGSLSIFCIRKNCLSDRAVASLASALSLGQLEVLNLKANKVTDGGVFQLCSVLGQCPSLRLVNLRFNDVTCDGAVALASAIASPVCNVRVLRLRENKIRYRGAEALANILWKLEELDLEGNKVTPAGATLLWAAQEQAMAAGRSPLLLLSPSLSKERLLAAAQEAATQVEPWLQEYPASYLQPMPPVAAPPMMTV